MCVVCSYNKNSTKRKTVMDRSIAEQVSQGSPDFQTAFGKAFTACRDASRSGTSTPEKQAIALRLFIEYLQTVCEIAALGLRKISETMESWLKCQQTSIKWPPDGTANWSTRVIPLYFPEAVRVRETHPLGSYEDPDSSGNPTCFRDCALVLGEDGGIIKIGITSPMTDGSIGLPCLCVGRRINTQEIASLMKQHPGLFRECVETLVGCVGKARNRALNRTISLTEALAGLAFVLAEILPKK